MSNFRKDIENKFDEAFNDFEVKPSEKVWNNIENKLHTQKAVKLNKSKLPILVGSVILLITSIFLFTNKINKNEKTLSLKNNTNEYIGNERINFNYNDSTDSKLIEQTFNSNNIIDNKKITSLENNQTISKHSKVENSNNVEIFAISEAIKINFTSEKSDNLNQKNKLQTIELSENKGCVPLCVFFSSYIENAENIKWNFGNGATSTSKNPEYIYTQAGTYIVCFEFWNNNIKNELFDTVKIYEKPKSKFEIAAKEELTIDNDINFVNNSQNAVNFKWYFGDKQISEQFEPKHKYILSNDYIVKLLVISDKGCMDSSVISINVKDKKQDIVFPNAFKPSNSGSNGGYYNANGISNNEVFYPAYSSGIDEYELNIYNRKGILIFQSKDINIGWDGYYKGEKVKASEVYVYLAKVKFTNGEEKTLRGSITVL